MTITSRDNRLVRELRHLLTDSKFRRESGLFAIEGARLCADAAQSGVAVQYVLYTPRAAEQYAVHLDKLHDVSTEMVEISEELARYIGDTASPQGIFSVCKMLDNCCTFDTIGKNKKYLALEDMQDPTNLGTVIRTAEALGLDGLLLSAGCCDLYNPKVLRGSMGGVFRLPVYMVGDMEKTVITLQNEYELCCYACVVDTDATPLHQIDFTSGSVCLIGNEGNGLRDHTIAACSHRLTIRMPGRAESLNASMAAGIVMWEMVRSTL